MIEKLHSDSTLYIQWSDKPIRIPGFTVVLPPMTTAYFFTAEDVRTVVEAVNPDWQILAQAAIREIAQPMPAYLNDHDLRYLYAPVGIARATKYIKTLKTAVAPGIAQASRTEHRDPKDTWYYLITLINHLERVPQIACASIIPATALSSSELNMVP